MLRENQVGAVMDIVGDAVTFFARRATPPRPAIGYLYILYAPKNADVEDPEIFLCTPIGCSEAAPDQWRRYRRNAREKAERLYRLSDDPNSWVSRNEQEGRWGGAVRVGDYILSFSGLPQEMDEVSMLILAYHFKLITGEQERGIASPPAFALWTELFQDQALHRPGQLLALRW